MRDLGSDTITQAVRASFSGTPDPRLKSILDNLVGHLHDHVREVGLTLDEWRAAIAFLTRVGQTCDDRRQEFILLSDVLGVSMLADAINHPQSETSTAGTILGPFYIDQPPAFTFGEDIAGGMAGPPLLITGAIIGRNNAPLPGAVVDVWHADAEGFYDVQNPAHPIAGRGRLIADSDGRFRIWSVMPKFYPIPSDGPVGDLLAATARHPYRPAHVHFLITAPGYDPLTTQIYDADSEWLESDAVFGVKASLVSPFVDVAPDLDASEPLARRAYRWLEHDFVLNQSCELAQSDKRNAA